ncbi:MAG: KEOPS complex subunit Pcc1 [Vulcanisaeta sp.]
MRIRGKVVLEITMDSANDCQVAIKSLMPDEMGLPQGLSSSIRCIDNKLMYEISYDIDSERLLSVYNTIDDFIRNLKVVMNSLNQLRG